MAFLAQRSRKALVWGSVVAPSVPQFHDQLPLPPSTLLSPFSKLYFAS